MHYDDENEEDIEFAVFLSHGQNPIWKDVQRYIRNELNVKVITLIPLTNRGRSVLEKLDEETEDCHYAIVVMTAEDEQANGGLRARQSVVHELGYCHGKFGRENVLVLRQSNTEEFSNMFGIIHESFSGNAIQTTFKRIRKELKDAIDRFMVDDDEDE